MNSSLIVFNSLGDNSQCAVFLHCCKNRFCCVQIFWGGWVQIVVSKGLLTNLNTNLYEAQKTNKKTNCLPFLNPFRKSWNTWKVWTCSTATSPTWATTRTACSNCCLSSRTWTALTAKTRRPPTPTSRWTETAWTTTMTKVGGKWSRVCLRKCLSVYNRLLFFFWNGCFSYLWIHFMFFLKIGIQNIFLSTSGWHEIHFIDLSAVLPSSIFQPHSVMLNMYFNFIHFKFVLNED